MQRTRRKYRLLNLFIVGLFVLLGCNLCAPPGSRESVEETARVKALMYTPLTPTQTPTPSQTLAPVTVTPTLTSAPQPVQPQLTVIVSTSQTGYSKTGEVIVYTYTVKNTGQAAVGGPFKLVDEKADQWKCDPAANLPVGGQLICKGYYRIRENDLCSSVTNVAHVEGMLQGMPIKSNQVSVTVYSGRNCAPHDNEPDEPAPATPCPGTSC